MMFSFSNQNLFEIRHSHYPVNPSSDHFHIDAVVPSSDHCCTETLSSGDHYCIDMVVTSSDHCFTKKVAPPSDHLHPCGGPMARAPWPRRCVALYCFCIVLSTVLDIRCLHPSLCFLNSTSILFYY